jgi:hypothetical protein
MSVAGERDVVIDYIRQGRRVSAPVSLMAAPDDPPREARELSRETVLPGMRLVRVNPAVIAEFNLPLEATGVLVAEPGRFGARVGLQPGDVIRLINGSRMADPSMVERVLSQRGRFRLAVLRGDRRIVLTFKT